MYKQSAVPIVLHMRIGHPHLAKLDARVGVTHQQLYNTGKINSLTAPLDSHAADLGWPGMQRLCLPKLDNL